MKKFYYTFTLVLAFLPIVVIGQVMTPQMDVIPTTIAPSIDLNGLQNAINLNGFSSANEEPIKIDSTPTHPRPYQDVSLKISSNITDLDRATITWRINGVIKLSQIGATAFSFTMGSLTESKSITVDIERFDKTVLSKTYLFSPSELNLIYEPQTYVPPFYRGRAWPTHQAEIAVIALPRMVDDFDRPIPANAFIYTWSVDGRVDSEQSGYGKNVFKYTNGILAENTRITVEAESRDTGQVTETSTTINPVEPVLVLYEKNPIYGTIFEQAVTDTYLLTRPEITLEAHPLFSSITNAEYSWFMNGNQITNLEKPREITFRIENNTSGRANIEARVSNNSKLLQSSAAKLTLLFDKIEQAKENINF